MDYCEKGWRRFLPDVYNRDLGSNFAASFAAETVCVTGAGGDIGSALVKALAWAGVPVIIALDSSEHGLFEIQRHMEANHPQTDCKGILGSVEDTALLSAAFSQFRPQIVFHAAAFKHVGLLEHRPFAAIENNALGTYVLGRAALEQGIPKVVLVSTDKAVNPHSVMGVSKRIAELIMLSLSCGTFRASVIRLGNVIGSRGSVIPIFLDQIKNAKPVFVTHPQASRYFLSREEAVRAILRAAAAACDGRVLIPQLGAPVLVADIAKFLVETYYGNGKSPLRFTGLRPGEKLTEDLIGGNETEAGTDDGVTALRTETLSTRECDEAVAQLSSCIAHRNHAGLLRCLCQLVPEYVPSELMQKSANSYPVSI